MANTKKFNSGWHNIVLSDRQMRFIKKAINLYYISGDKREAHLIEAINKRLDGEKTEENKI